MDKIHCLVCGYEIKLPQYIDSERYDGELRCETCSARLHIKLAGSKVHKYKVVSEENVPKTIQALYEIAEKHRKWEEQSKKNREEQHNSVE